MILALILALLLDAALGEPRWLYDRLPHPAVAMGRLIGWGERRFNNGSGRLLKGGALWLALAFGAGLLGLALAAIPGQWVDVLVCAAILAQRSLADHVRAVADALRLSLPEGRRAVARIVGRDTAAMDTSSVARGAIESAAENLSDGVIAPAFWFLVGGLPGLMIYKITNTADSMIGYRDARYEQFGKVAARADDLMNLIPARLTAGLIRLLPPAIGTWAGLARDARRHRSPNAGWPEAALARHLDVALSGPRSYGGAVRDFPFVHPDGAREIGADEIDAAARALWRVWALTLALLAAAWLVQSVLA